MLIRDHNEKVMFNEKKSLEAVKYLYQKMGTDFLSKVYNVLFAACRP